MVRSAFVAGCVFAFAPAVFGQNCDLSGDFFLAICTGPVAPGQTSHCTMSLKNTGPVACNGTWTGAFGAIDPGSASNGNSTFGGCSVAGSYPFPQPIGGLTAISPAAVCQAVGTLSPGATFTMSADVTPATTSTGFSYKGGFVGLFQSSSMLGTTSVAGYGSLAIQLANCTAIPSAPGVAPSGVPYFVEWNSTNSGGQFEIQESLTPDFANPTTTMVPATLQIFTHTVSSATTFYYRVRPVICAGQPGSFGPVAQVVVVPPQPPTSHDFDIPVPIGTTSPISQTVTFSGLPAGAAFSAKTDEPFLTVTPSSGTVRSDGTVTVTVQATPTSTMPVGANTATVTLSVAGGKGPIMVNDSRSTVTTVSVSLVTPVSSTPKNAPPNDALIVPAVAHLEGVATFRSDVRITNAGTSANGYQLSFTPQNSDGTMTGKQIQITIGGGQTVALNDILKDYFGFADPSAQAGGVLDIRLVSGTPGTTFVSSRTYAATTNGTFGQFVPAVPISKFLKQGQGSLTLTNVANSSAFRTNIGLVEGLGQSAAAHLKFFDANGQSLGPDYNFTLQPFEFKQLGGLLPSTTNGRIELVVDSPNAGVTTYASVLDNTTQDPLLVSPIQTSTLSANRYVLPGMADFASTFSNFHSDVRIYNPTQFTVNATATFYPQANGAPIVQNISIAGGEVKAYNNVLPTLFLTPVNMAPNGGGAMVVTTPNNIPLIVSGRTYSNADTGGTFGQFIPAVTPADGIGIGDSPLQVLQLEQSANFRSNLGLNELTGNPVTVRVTLIPAGSKTAAVLPDITLQPNEFRQLNAVFGQAYPGQSVYNGRATIAVVGGTGRATAYGSVVDNQTSDPTYVPAQK